MNSTPETAEIISNLISLRYLTRDTLAVFLAFAGTSEDEGRDPEVDCTSPRDKGHITNLKKAGLVTTYVCNGDELGILWVSFTDRGRALAADHGINVFDNRTGLPYEPPAAEAKRLLKAKIAEALTATEGA